MVVGGRVNVLHHVKRRGIAWRGNIRGICPLREECVQGENVRMPLCFIINYNRNVHIYTRKYVVVDVRIVLTALSRLSYIFIVSTIRVSGHTCSWQRTL